MKQKIFNKGNGWYISANNYKDKEDKCYINIFFPKGTDPVYIDNGRGFSVKDIDIEEMKFTSYKGKAGVTIFKYKLLDSVDEENKSFSESIKGTEYAKNFGTDASVTIEESELPFY